MIPHARKVQIYVLFQGDFQISFRDKTFYCINLTSKFVFTAFFRFENSEFEILLAYLFHVINFNVIHNPAYYIVWHLFLPSIRHGLGSYV